MYYLKTLKPEAKLARLSIIDDNQAVAVANSIHCEDYGETVIVIRVDKDQEIELQEIELCPGGPGGEAYTWVPTDML